MTPTVYQKPEIRDANDNIIQQGAFGKNTALANATNDGWIDYVVNDLEFLYDIAKDEVVPVPALPASGQTNKTYLLTTTGVSYRWSGTEWVAVSSSEAVGRAESAANLAEQWATKTDGTVDGTEYSAKYYAGLAEASADDAQDVADDMADHLVQIDKNTGGVANNSKRISNIEKLLQGNLYDYDTDDDVAYTKTVPSGALPYAGVEQIGGKTLVWNQQCKTTRSGATKNGITFTNNGDGSWTINGTAEASSNVYFDVITLNLNHKYFLRGCPAGGSSSTYNLGFNGHDTDTGSGGIETPTSITTGNFRFNFHTGDSFDNVTVYPQIFDLTLMFGVGNEPSTVAEFEAMFPASYYSYNAGTLLSAGVTEVESVGKNLWKMQMAGFGGYYNVAVGSKAGINGQSVPLTDNGDGSFTFTTDNATWHGALFLVPIDITKNYRLHFSFSDANGNSGGTFYLLDQDYTVLYKSAYSSPRSVDVGFGGANTEYPTAVYACIGVGAANTTSVTVTVTNPMVEIGETSTTYVPYKEATMPIPAEVQALTGYGWSAGILHNYVDFERKVFVKQVGEVVLNGTENWSKTTVAAGVENYVRGYTTIADMLPTTDTSAHDDTMITTSELLPSCNVETNSGQGDGIHRRSNGTKGLMIGMAGGTDIDVIKTHLANKPLTVHYPLETPIETDISQYLTDNLIEVGADGTLTFPNSNGDDYHIPVPSTETYMIDLQEAISNG